MMKTYRERTAEAAIAARNKYKVAEIATKCGVSRQAVYSWINGEYPVEDGPALVELASADFWATIHFFVKGA